MAGMHSCLDLNWVNRFIRYKYYYVIFQFFDRLHANTLATRLTVPRCEGRLVVGRRIRDVDGQYQSLEIDELLIFNQKLSLQEAALLAV